MTNDQPLDDFRLVPQHEAQELASGSETFRGLVHVLFAAW